MNHDRVELLGWDHLELWVGNARAYTAFLSSAFGFDVVAYAGPETGWSRAAVSYVLEQGELRLQVFKARECSELNLAFWTWHDKVEDQHAAHTDDELEEAFASSGFDEDRFLDGAREVLDAVAAFWGGLDADRRARSDRAPAGTTAVAP